MAADRFSFFPFSGLNARTFLSLPGFSNFGKFMTVIASLSPRNILRRSSPFIGVFRPDDRSPCSIAESSPFS